MPCLQTQPATNRLMVAQGCWGASTMLKNCTKQNMDCDPSFLTVSMQLDCSDFNHEKSCNPPRPPYVPAQWHHFLVCNVTPVYSVPFFISPFAPFLLYLLHAMPIRFLPGSMVFCAMTIKPKFKMLPTASCAATNILHITCFYGSITKEIYILKKMFFVLPWLPFGCALLFFFQSGKHVLKWWWWGRVGVPTLPLFH